MLISSMASNGPPVPSHKMGEFRNVTHMLPRSYSSPRSQPQSSSSKGSPRPRQASSRESKTRVKLNSLKESPRKVTVPPETKKTKKAHIPTYPSPLRQVTTYSDLEGKRASFQNSDHPSFQEILYEVILDGDSTNSIIGSFEYKETHKPGNGHHSTSKNLPRKISASVLGASATSKDIINSTLLDGPYRQTQPKINQVAGPNSKPKTIGVPDEKFLRGSRLSTLTISSPNKHYPQVKSSSKSAIEAHGFSSKDRLTSRTSTTNMHRHSKIPNNRLKHSSGTPKRYTQDDMCFVVPLDSDSSDDLCDFKTSQQNRNYVKNIKEAAKSIVNSALPTNMRRVSSTPSKPDSGQKKSGSLSSPKLSKTSSSRETEQDNKITDLTEKKSRHQNVKLDKQVLSETRVDSQAVSNKTPTKNHHPEVPCTQEPNLPKIEMGSLENIDAKLGYNHFTKMAKLVYFENGVPPKKTLLPKGHLIPPSQLTLHDFSSKNPTIYCTDSSNNISECVNSDKPPFIRPSIPLKSPARRLNSVKKPDLEPQSHDNSTVPDLNPEQSKSIPKDQANENDSSTQLDIRSFLSRSGGKKMRKLSLQEALDTSTLELSGTKVNPNPYPIEVFPASHPEKIRPVVSAFDKKVRILFGTVIPLDSSANSLKRNSITQPYCLGPRTSLSVIGSMGCTVLSGKLFKLGGNLQWQKREFRTDGFSLVCLSKDLIKLPSGSLYMDQPDYLNVDWKSYFQPTSPPVPHITHPLVATPADADASKLGYYQTPKWVIPIGDIVKLNMLTRKGVRVPDSFVIHTRSRNYIVKAENSRVLAAWLYILQRMIISFKDSRDLIPGLIPDPLSRCASASSDKPSLNTKILSNPSVVLPTPEPDSPITALSSQESAIFVEPSSDSQPVCRHPGEDRRSSSLFNRYDPSQPLDSKVPLSLQLQREIVHDWVNSLSTLNQLQ